jgi:hypothetical protein
MDPRQGLVDFDAVTVSLRVDKDPTHYIDGIPPDDARRLDGQLCDVCGLLSEYQTDWTDIVTECPPGHHLHTRVCRARCEKRLPEMCHIIESMYK